MSQLSRSGMNLKCLLYLQAAASQVLVCKTTIRKQKQKEKQMYANMFDKFAKHDTEVTGSRGLLNTHAHCCLVT